MLVLYAIILEYSSDSSSEVSDEEDIGAARAVSSHTTQARDKKRHRFFSCSGSGSTSDRNAIYEYLLTESARVLGHDVKEFNINRSSIRRYRMLQRAKFAASLKAEFRAYDKSSAERMASCFLICRRNSTLIASPSSSLGKESANSFRSPRSREVLARSRFGQ